MFNLIIDTLDYVIDLDYGVVALKVIFKTAEIGIKIVMWSLQ